MENIEEISAEQVREQYQVEVVVQDEGEGLETVEGELPEAEELKEEA